MTIDEIKELIHVVRETGIFELEVQRGENKVRIRTTAASGESGSCVTGRYHCSFRSNRPCCRTCFATAATTLRSPNRLPRPLTKMIETLL